LELELKQLREHQHADKVSEEEGLKELQSLKLAVEKKEADLVKRDEELRKVKL
jgi:hypothetical protein